MAGIDKTYIKSYAQYREIADWCKAQGTVTDSFGNKITPYDYIPHNWEYPSIEEDPHGFARGIDLGEYTEEDINKWLDSIRKRNDKKFKTEKYWKECCQHYEDYRDKYPTFESWCEYIDTLADIPLWNTDHIFDIYLIKNCPVQFIQDRLKVQYGGGWSKESMMGNNDSYEAIKNGTSVYDTYQRNGLKNPHFKINWKQNIPFKDDDVDWFIEVFVDGKCWDYDSVADHWYSYNECYYPISGSWCSACDFKYCGNMSKRRIYRLLKKWNLPAGAKVNFRGYYHRHLIKTFTVNLKK